MKFSLKYYNPSITISVILILAGLIDFFYQRCLYPYISENIESFEGIIRGPSNATIIGAFLYIHNKFLWKLPIFKLLVRIPDMNGRYKGSINYVFKKQNGTKECVIEIKQDASNIKVNSYFKNDTNESTYSESIIEDIKEKDGFYNVYFFFQNSGTKSERSLDSHEGANILKFLPNGGTPKLKGHYFTNRLTQTKGEIEVLFESKIRKGEF